MTTYLNEGEIVAVQNPGSQLLLGAMVCGDRQNGHVTVRFAAGNSFRVPLGRVSVAPQWIVDEYRRLALKGGGLSHCPNHKPMLFACSTFTKANFGQK